MSEFFNFVAFLFHMNLCTVPFGSLVCHVSQMKTKLYYCFTVNTIWRHDIFKIYINCRYFCSRNCLMILFERRNELECLLFEISYLKMCGIHSDMSSNTCFNFGKNINTILVNGQRQENNLDYQLA